MLSIGISKESGTFVKTRKMEFKNKIALNCEMNEFPEIKLPKMTACIQFFALQFNDLSKMRKTKRLIKFFELDVV